MGNVKKFPIPDKTPFGKLKMEQLFLDQSDVSNSVKVDSIDFFCTKCGRMAVDKKKMKCIICGEKIINASSESEAKRKKLTFVKGGCYGDKTD